MNAIKILLLLGIFMLIPSCIIQSLHPLFDEQDLVFNTTLVGKWIEEGSMNSWTFQKSGEKSHILDYYEESGDTARFSAKMGKLGKHLFLDIFPQKEVRGYGNRKNTLYELHLIPAHTFSKILIEGDTLRVALLDQDWLKEMIAQKKVTVGHEEREGTIILTASTKELQRFIRQYAEDTKAFPEPGKLHRMK